MIPEIIMHNSISIDGSLTQFSPDMEVHYQIAGSFHPDAHLIGSQTAKAGIEQFLTEVPQEKQEDTQKPKTWNNADLPYWILVDSQGLMNQKLHLLRSFEFCRDVIVLISSNTPEEYIRYLQSRDYDYIQTGKKKVDLKNALEKIHQKYHVKKILTDCGETLNSILLRQGLLRKISLLISPELVGNTRLHFFQSLDISHQKMRLISFQKFKNNYLHVFYELKEEGL